MTFPGAHRVAITGCGTVNPGFVGGSPEVSEYLATPRALVRAERSDRLAAVVQDRDLEAFLDPAEQRRLSRVSQLTVVAARLALADARLSSDDVALLVGTELGDLRSTMEFANGFLERGPTGLSALLFPNTVMNTMAAGTAIAVQARAATLTLNAPVVAGELAVARAAAGVAAGRFSAVLAGGVDQLDPLLQEKTAELGAGTDARGEGATFLVLEPHEAALDRGAPILGEVSGWDWRSLPAAPCGVGAGAESRAIARALARARIGADAIGWVYDSASLDPARDDWERAVLETALPHRPATASLARWLGRHAGLGALRVAGALSTARTGRLPAIGGAVDVRRGPGLVHALARGGAHVALIVQAPDS
jgi:3-oxoacyl-[acyl-carrier-protein] synthase II